MEDLFDDLPEGALEDLATSSCAGSALLPPDAWLLLDSGEEALLRVPEAPGATPQPVEAGEDVHSHAGRQQQQQLSVLRCLDPGHARPCGYCAPAPVESEIDDYELVGENVREGGLKKLRAQVVRTREWNSAAERRALAAVLERRGDGASARLAAVLRAKQSPALVKGHLLRLARAWGYASTLWLRHGRASRGAAAAGAGGAAGRAQASQGGGGGGVPQPLGALASAALPATLVPAEVRLLGGSYPWLVAPACPGGGGGGGGGAAATLLAGCAASAPPAAAAFLAAAAAEAAAVLRPLSAAAAALLAGGAAAARCAECCGAPPGGAGLAPFFGRGDLDHVLLSAAYYDGEAARWAGLAAAAQAEAAGEGATTAAAAAAASWRLQPAARPSPALAAAAAALASLALDSRRHATHNCAVAFRTHPALLEALRSGALPSVEHALTGESPPPPQPGGGGGGGGGWAEPAADVAPGHAAGVAAFSSELFCAFCCLFELLTRVQLLLAEARLAGAHARAAALVAPLVGRHLEGAGAGMAQRARWMRDALDAAPPGAQPPRSRLLFMLT